MMMGKVTVSSRAVETHRASYCLDELKVVAVERPLLPGAMLFGAGGSGFALAFGDLLYSHEIAGLALGAGFILLAGFRLARIQLLSRDLRGSELSCMVWGSWGRLQRVRREIVAAIEESAAARGEHGGAAMKFLAFMIAVAAAWLALPFASDRTADWALGIMLGFYTGFTAASLLLIWEVLLFLLLFATTQAGLRLLGAAAGLIVTLWLVARERLK